MTETEWLAGTRPTGMLLFLGLTASERKVLLFNLACCRRVWALFDTEDQEAMIQAEAGADNPNAIRELQLRLEPQRTAALAMAGLLDRERHAVSDSLARLLATRTTVRLRLDGTRGPGIGSLAFAAAGLAEGAAPEGARPAARSLEEWGQAELVREIFGNPFRPVAADPSWLRWNDGAVQKVARSIYDGRRFEDLPILADALLDAGCDSGDILDHCRSPGPHVRGCWVVDLLLAKE